MLNKELEFTLNIAFKQAHDKHHEFMTVEHMLLALLDNTSAVTVLRGCGLNIEALRAELQNFIDETTPLLKTDKNNKDDRDTQPTLGFQRVLQRAVFHVQSSGKNEVTGANVLAAIFSEQESQAVYFLKRENITRLDVINFISRNNIGADNSYLKNGFDKLNPLNQLNQEPLQDEFNRPPDDIFEAPHDNVAKSPLESYAINLNNQAQTGYIDPLIGREKEVQRVVQILCRRRKNNPLLVGEAGVGKTAIAEGLAKMIVDGKTPEVLAKAKIYALDLGALLAGTKYRGDFEKRFKALLTQLSKETNAVLFIDEIHTIIGAGAASGGVMDASNLIKPLLASGKLKCMGSTTFQEYRGIFEKDHALTRRFQKIDVEEPSKEETYNILCGLKSRLEEHHQLKYEDSALILAVDLAQRYITDRFLPDKAIDIVDEAGAYQQLQPVDKRKKIITTTEIEEIVAKIVRIPTQQISKSEKEILNNLERDLKLLIYGQEHAIVSLVDAIKIARSGLHDLTKPVGSFLFAGPTGVGKTEVTKQLAKLLGLELIRFDMSEYMERHTVSRLIGAPPGYVGFDQGGLLTEAVTQKPHSVLLLDEIEKAHPDVFNLLLQIMDHGTLTDNNGRKADFRHVILVMTTNAGAQELSRSSMGFKKQEHLSESHKIIEKTFPPEFRNRLDGIISFNSLTQDNILNVVDKFITELEVQLHDKNITLNVSTQAKSWLIKNGFNQALGARPMVRLISDKIKKQLAHEVLFGKLINGGIVEVTEKDGDIDLKIYSVEPSKNKATNQDLVD
ncbi:MAG: ATP-dependent Clp protease ATP-binding subunit ClpA [Gammaproteobacteria bacterium]|nr:ATP-dependent Clp protease ATP-binding subunit ClpA [Gammaproteobacteria bacterium]